MRDTSPVYPGRFFHGYSHAVTRRLGDGAMGRIAAPRRWCWLGVPSAATTRHSDGWNGCDASALMGRRVRQGLWLVAEERLAYWF
jgi:hypothetical protein